MRRIAATATLLAAMMAPAAPAGAESWSLRGTPSELRAAQAALDGHQVERRPGRLIVRGASRDQLRGLSVQRVDRVAPAYLAIDPHSDDDWAIWNTVWGLNDAWLVGQGQGAIVAVVDTGVQLDHPDLQPNIWTNPGEVPDNAVDDDGNGYVDDVHGVSVIDGKQPYDKHGHGTHVAGIVAAQVDGHGTNGIAPRATIMPVQALKANSEGTSSDVAEAIQYAVKNGAQVINVSITSPFVTPEQQRAFDAAEQKGVLIVGAAGNEKEDTDTSGRFPTALDHDNLITVASVDNDGRLSKFSNYGKRRVDVGAFGENIPSTYPTSGYALMTGTSMAAPMIAGQAAILAGLYPQRGGLEWRQALLSHTNELSGLVGKTATGGTPYLPEALAWEAEQVNQPLPKWPARFRDISVDRRRRGSRYRLRISWRLVGAGAGDVVQVTAKAGRRSATTRRRSLVLANVRRGSVSLSLVARDSDQAVRAQKTLRLRLR